MGIRGRGEKFSSHSCLLADLLVLQWRKINRKHMDKILKIASDCVEKALKNGASAADAIVVEHSDLNVRCRMGKSETIERAESQDLGLRVLIKDKEGFRQAIVSSNDFSAKTIPQLVERAVSMAKIAPVDKFIGLAGEELLSKKEIDLDLCDKAEPEEKKLEQMALAAEAAALGIKGVTNSEGASADFDKSSVVLVTSNGFARTYNSSSYSVSASIIAGTGLAMETDYDYSVARHFKDLKNPEEVGKSAGMKAAAKLNPRKIKTCSVPVVFDARVAAGFLSSIAAAINGASIARGTSFLKDKMGQKIFSDNINIIDDPHIKRGLASKAFDAEGISGKKLNVIESGVLTSWIMDLRSAKQLGLKTTGHASRGTSSPPSPSSTNFYLQKGKQSVDELIADIKQGLFVTDGFGDGANLVTGDYSQGIYGFWIENGKKTFAVSEVTIAGHMFEMMKNLTPANDLEFKYGTNSPTLRIEGMTIAGL
mgnify:CR=1 FL=1